jgi:hypothetical protein
MALPDGLYDLLLTERLLSGLDLDRADLGAFTSERTELLLDALARQLASALEDTSTDETDSAARQVELVNALLVLLRQRLPAHRSTQEDSPDLIASPPRVLRSIQRDRQFPSPPELGLAAPWLFTAGKGSPSLLQEIRKELGSADEVDILVSFITVSGVRKLQDVLQQITARGGQRHYRHPPAHSDHHLHRRHRSSCPGRIGTPTRLRGSRLARRPTDATAREGLALPPAQRVRIGLRRQRQPLRCRSNRRT